MEEHYRQKNNKLKKYMKQEQIISARKGNLLKNIIKGKSIESEYYLIFSIENSRN